jgi:hypothetical protein
MGADTLIPYLWAATGLVSLVAIVLLIYWAHTQNQFDEEIKKQMFTEGDDDRYGKTRPG